MLSQQQIDAMLADARLLANQEYEATVALDCACHIRALAADHAKLLKVAEAAEAYTRIIDDGGERCDELEAVRDALKEVGLNGDCVW